MQRPSVDIVTGTIKANITSRIAFFVASQIDSRTMIDAAGAEKLLGNGDMLFVCDTYPKPKRIQGALLTPEEKDAVIGYLKKQAEPDYLEEVTDEQNKGIPGFSGTSSKTDILLAQAMKIVTNPRYNKASATLLQRTLSIGYARAAKILDQLEEAGVVGPANGPKPREVLIREEEMFESPVIETNQNGMNEELEEFADDILEKDEYVEDDIEDEADNGVDEKNDEEIKIKETSDALEDDEENDDLEFEIDEDSFKKDDKDKLDESH